MGDESPYSGISDLGKALFYMTPAGHRWAQGKFYLDTARERAQFTESNKEQMARRQAGDEEIGRVANLETGILQDPQAALQQLQGFIPQTPSGRVARNQAMYKAHDVMGRTAAMKAATTMTPGQPMQVTPTGETSGLPEFEPSKVQYTPSTPPQLPTYQQALQAIPPNMWAAAEPHLRTIRPPRDPQQRQADAESALYKRVYSSIDWTQPDAHAKFADALGRAGLGHYRTAELNTVRGDTRASRLPAPLLGWAAEHNVDPNDPRNEQQIRAGYAQEQAEGRARSRFGNLYPALVELRDKGAFSDWNAVPPAVAAQAKRMADSSDYEKRVADVVTRHRLEQESTPLPMSKYSGLVFDASTGRIIQEGTVGDLIQAQKAQPGRFVTMKDRQQADAVFRTGQMLMQNGEFDQMEVAMKSVLSSGPLGGILNALKTGKIGAYTGPMVLSTEQRQQLGVLRQLLGDLPPVFNVVVNRASARPSQLQIERLTSALESGDLTMAMSALQTMRLRVEQLRDLALNKAQAIPQGAAPPPTGATNAVKPPRVPVKVERVP